MLCLLTGGAEVLNHSELKVVNQSLTQAAVKVKGLLSVYVKTGIDFTYMYIYLCVCPCVWHQALALAFIPSGL